jgi:hypothetical protein
VTGFQLADRVADMTVLGSNAAYRTLRADDLTRVPADHGEANPRRIPNMLSMAPRPNWIPAKVG